MPERQTPNGTATPLGVFFMGLRIDTRQMVKDFERKRNKITAAQFRPELLRFAQRTLTTALKSTPVRDFSVIAEAQTKQYAKRINYIPSVHETSDPMLIVNEAGEFWLHSGGKWYAASYRALPPEQAAQLAELEAERDRRLSTPRPAFIAGRSQARFLYRKSWWEVAVSLGITIPVDAKIMNAHSRHEPKAEPPKGYGQWRGGKVVLSIIIYNPLLESESRYKPFSGKAILNEAAAVNEAAFLGEVAAKLRTLLLTA